MGAIHSIRDVAERHLCAGCGACAFAQPDVIHMVDTLDHGRRPVVADVNGAVADTRPALAVCPGLGVAHEGRHNPATVPELRDAWGPVLEVWEGHAADEVVRHGASSGGVATALAVHCVEHEGMYGALHVAARADVPYLNQTVLSTTRAQLLEAMGSRYAPASPCEGLGLIERAPGPCVFIGKPCDVAGAVRSRRLRPGLEEKLALTIGFFCAGTPSTRGTLEMARRMGVLEPDAIRRVRYRGNGWPGAAEVEVDDGDERVVHRMSYEESWGDVLQRHRQWRCSVCADHTAELADVAVGDPWYREIPPGEPGRSLVLVRTRRGRDAVRRAMACGCLVLTPAPPAALVASQPNLLRARGAVWGRSLVSRVLGVPAPTYRNLPTFAIWWRHLTVKEKAQSLYGTVRRVRTRRLRRRVRFE